jgi:hypothetical protein
MKNHKYLRIAFINEWKEKTEDKHITPVITYASRKYDKGNYYYAVALEWWCWAITIGFLGVDVRASVMNHDALVKSLGRLNVFGKKIF